MKFEEAPLTGAWIIRQDRVVDERGFFARTFAREEFAVHGLAVEVVHCNTSFNRERGTLRGLHWQVPPYAEAKLIRCTSGVIHDVIVDLRPGSPTHLQSFSLELNEADGTMLYCPEEFAHGFVTLTDEAEVAYQMSQAYSPEHARGARWNDPALAIRWPVAPRIVSDKDRSWPDLAP